MLFLLHSSISLTYTPITTPLPTLSFNHEYTPHAPTYTSYSISYYSYVYEYQSYNNYQQQTHKISHLLDHYDDFLNPSLPRPNHNKIHTTYHNIQPTTNIQHTLTLTSFTPLYSSLHRYNNNISMQQAYVYKKCHYQQ